MRLAAGVRMGGVLFRKGLGWSVILGLLAAALLAGCGERRAGHPLVGAWLAEDGTIFDFRPDGTFHGVDFRKREIWGNWVTLSPTRIGFQSLLHDAFYNPQYAIIRERDADAMDYIVSGGTGFIAARRIEPGNARAAIEVLVAPRVHRP